MAPAPSTAPRPPIDPSAPAARRALEVALALNTLMFAIEGIAGAWINSAMLLAGAAAYLAHAGALARVAWVSEWETKDRRFAELVLGLTLGATGIAAAGEIIRRLIFGGAPDAVMVAQVAGLGVIVSLICAWRLARAGLEEGGARSLWRAVRRDVVFNLLVLVAAALIMRTHWRWPDVLVGLALAGFNLWAGRDILGGVGRSLAPRPLPPSGADDVTLGG